MIESDVQPAIAPVAIVSKPSARLNWIDGMLLILMVIWGTNFVLLKAALEIMPPFVINGIRFSLAALCLFVLFRLQGLPLVLPRREWLPIILLSLVGNAIYQGIWLTSLSMTTVGNNALLSSTIPIWVLILNAVLRIERPSRRGLIGVGLALIGVIIVIVGKARIEFTGQTLAGDGLALLAAFIWASMLLVSRSMVERHPVAPMAFWQVLWGAVFQVLFSLPQALALNWSAIPANAFVALVYSAVVSIGIGHLAWTVAVKRLGTTRPALYTYLEPAIAGLAAVLLLNEQFSSALILGGSLVLCGVLLARRS